MNQFTKTLLAAGLAFGAISAQAAPVTTWSYTVSSIWANASPLAPTPSDGVTISPDQLKLSWPTGDASQSSLVISGNESDGSQTGSVDTFIGGPAVPQVSPYLALGNTLTHNNFVINGTSLDSATLQATLMLTPTAPPGSSYTPSSLNVNIGFSETDNTSTLAGCLVASSPTPCNDIFVLTGGLLNQSFFYDVGTGSQEYFVNVFPVIAGALGQLPTAVCLDAGGDPTLPDGAGCLGFTTPENQSTPLQFAFTISTQRLSLVPEPGTLALAGLALLGAGLARRRVARKA